MQNPSISVIVPCYNAAPFLQRSLGSLVRQTFSDFEIIAIDDGSTDDTPQVLQSWAEQDARLRVVRQENMGLYLARLTGIRHAHAAWITFMDADDEVETHHLESLWGKVDGHTGVVVGGIVAVDSSGRATLRTPPFTALTMQQAAQQLLVGHHRSVLGYCWNKLYRRELLQEGWLMRPRLSYLEDQVFNLRVFLHGKDWQVRAVPHATYRYLSREGSLMRSITVRHVEEFFDLWRERDGAAREALHGESDLLRRYRLMHLIAVMDFYGNVYRSKNHEIALRFEEKLRATGWTLGLPLRHPVPAARWLKWMIRRQFARKNRFSTWLD
jgi:glycosyltransferase involved in cell wall biosynthesis